MSLVRAHELAGGYVPGRDALEAVSFALEAGADGRRPRAQRGRQDDAVPRPARRAPAAARDRRAGGAAGLRAPDRPRAAGLPGQRARRRADGRLPPHAVLPAAWPRRARRGRGRARARRPRRPRPRALRDAVGRPAPARADRPRAGPGRPRAAARRAAVRRRRAERRPHRGRAARAARRGPRAAGRHPRRRAGAPLRARPVPAPPPDRVRRARRGARCRRAAGDLRRRAGRARRRPLGRQRRPSPH